MASQPSSDRWRTLEPLLDAALELAPEHRDAFVAESCAGDGVLRAELIQLLLEYGVQDTLLDRPAAESFAALLDEHPTSLPAILSDRYRIERELGHGGMATVYLAWDIRHERHVAVKVLRPEIAAALGAQRFLAEIRLTAQLQHPHILPLHDSGDADGRLFYVMPYVDGESLRCRLEREKQLPIHDAVRIAGEIASALDAAHRRGVVHRDIKPENILLHDGAALVADFGIALALSAASPRATKPGLALGTPQYMSPEQATGDGTIDNRADIYALGTVVYEMLAGEAPYTGTSGTAIIAKRSAMPAPLLRILRPAVPVAIEAAVARALAREPADRPNTAGDFAEALRQALVDGGAEDATGRPGNARAGRRLGTLFVGLAVVLGAVGVALIARASKETSSPSVVTAPEAMNSIAVLPLADVGNDTTNGYFAASMTEFLNSALGKLPGLRVTPSGSTGVSPRGEQPVDFKVVGQKLGVAMLLQGSTWRAGGQLQVVAYLVSTRTGQTVWSNTYRREIHQAKDVFAVQDAIFNDIAGQLRITMAGTQTVAPTHPHTENLEALDLYMQGRFFLDRRTNDGLEKAQRYFERAIAADSNLAQAYTGLSDVYITYANGNLGDYRPSEYYPKARDFAQRALAIDPASADAHAYLGAVKLIYDLDWPGADRELSQAVVLDPRSSMGHLWRVTLLDFTGRANEALIEARTGLDVDPRSLFTNIENGRALLFARKYDGAADQLKRVLERDAASYRSHLLLGQVFEQTAKYDSAVAEMEAAVRLAPKSSRALAFLAHAHALAGDTSDALRELNALHERSRHAYVPAFDFALAYVGLGRMDETFDWLEKSFDDHSLRPYLMDATFDPIRSDRRYQPLLRKLRLPLDKPSLRQPR